MDEDTRKPLHFELIAGFDPFGDPQFQLVCEIPEGAVLSPDQIDEMAVHMLRSSASARAHSAIARKMMLDGVSPFETAKFLTGLMGQE